MIRLTWEFHYQIKRPAKGLNIASLSGEMRIISVLQPRDAVLADIQPRRHISLC